jgi:two-component system sensor histidine kinase CpxA
MRTLFAKILLWFLAAMLITTLGFVWITTGTFTAPREHHGPHHGPGPHGPPPHVFGGMFSLAVEEARHAYETGGRQQLVAYLDRLDHEFHAPAIFTDANGRDLLTGADRRDLIEQAARGPHSFGPPVFGPPVLGRETADGKYWLFLLPPHGRRGYSLLPLPQYLWIVGAMAALSYLLVLYLTAPLRNLKRTVEKFGHGDLAMRTNSTRHDEFGELARTFDRMADRIQTLLTAEHRLLLDISHELRSPLARLAVAVELARAGEDREAAIDRIQKEADRLNSLVTELLQVTRAEGDPLSLHAEPLRLDELLADIAGDCELEAHARECRIELQSPPPVTVRGDPELIRRAVENVVRNAIRYAPAGTSVEIGLARTQTVARISIRDRGPGVPPENLARIFDPFYRVDPGRDRVSGGVGLGLAIARRAVELHKGSIQARNAEPGLVVEIEFPLSFAPAMPEASSD